MLARVAMVMCLLTGIAHSEPSRLSVLGHRVEIRYAAGNGEGEALILEGHARVLPYLLVDIEASRNFDSNDGDTFGNPSLGARALVLRTRCYAFWAGIRGTIQIADEPTDLYSQRAAEALEGYIGFDRFDRYSSVRALGGYEQTYGRARYIATLHLGHAKSAPNDTFTRASRTFLEHIQEVAFMGDEGLLIGARFTFIAVDEPFERGGEQWSSRGTKSTSLGPFIGLSEIRQHVAWYARVGAYLGFGGAASGHGDLHPLVTLELRGGAVF